MATGVIGPVSVRAAPLWLHLEHLARRPDDPDPYPDLLQVVLGGPL
jgi:hypothetical protein